MNYLSEFKIQQLRTKNLTLAVESISVVLGAVIANMLVPQLLIKYVYTDTSALLEAPAIFSLLPLVTYSIALAFIVFALVTNFMRSRKANVLEQELMLMDDCCGSEGSCCNDSDEEEISDKELQELERIVDEALKPSKKKSTKTASKSKKKSVKKTT
jgi:hypothetical protein